MRNCELCNKAKDGEDLYIHNKRILCRYCLVSLLCELDLDIVYFGTAEIKQQQQIKVHENEKNV